MDEFLTVKDVAETMKDIELYIKAFDNKLEAPPSMIGRLGKGRTLTYEELVKEYGCYCKNGAEAGQNSKPELNSD